MVGPVAKREGVAHLQAVRASTAACDELLNESLFLDLDHARSRIANWIDDYNQRRPHSALGYLTPAAYAANLSATSDRLRNPDQLSRSHVAPSAPHGVKPAEALVAAG
jgi:putative transposase